MLLILKIDHCCFFTKVTCAFLASEINEKLWELNTLQGRKKTLSSKLLIKMNFNASTSCKPHFQSLQLIFTFSFLNQVLFDGFLMRNQHLTKFILICYLTVCRCIVYRTYGWILNQYIFKQLFDGWQLYYVLKNQR